jgi:hypothetical protein
VYAFPNDNVWLVRRRMLDWQALPSIVSLASSVRELQISPDRAPVTALGEGEPFPETAWLDAGEPARIRSAHPASFLQWRLRGRPGVEYPVYAYREGRELRGYIALKRYDRDGRAEGHIVAFRVEPGAESIAGPALLARAKAHFEATGVERVSAWLLPASPLHALVAAAGMRPEPGPGKNFGYLALESAVAPALADTASWDVMMSDSDVF